MKNKGNLLLEFLLNIFIFSIIMILLFFFLKRVLLIQNYKGKIIIINENSLNVFEVLKKHIKERDRENFTYNNEKGNIFVINDKNINSAGIIYKNDNVYYQIKFRKPKVLISSADEINGFKRWETIMKLENINFNLKDELLIITYNAEGKITDQVINIR